MSSKQVPSKRAVSVHAPRELIDAARAAFVTAQAGGGEVPRSFDGWVCRAVEQHAGRGVEGRLEAAAASSSRYEGVGIPRVVRMTSEALEAAEEAVRQEDQSPQWRLQSRNAVIVEALQVAIARTAEAHGGSLLEVPRRLRPPGPR